VAGKADWSAAGLPLEGTLAGSPTAGGAARRDVPTCPLTAHIGDVRDRLQAAAYKMCVVVNDADVVLGLLRGESLNADPQTAVEELMESGPTSVRPDVPLQDIVERMQSRKVGSVLVTTAGGRLVGILHRKDAEAMLAVVGG
jgi:CBS domain-containing protein